MTTHQQIHSSKSAEWYTPQWLIDPITEFLGTIDLDPCSNAQANLTVGADKYYTREDNGLDQVWAGRVFVNPPSIKGDKTARIQLWTQKLVRDVERGYIQKAILLVPAVPDRQWFHPLWAYPMCFLWERIRFDAPAGQKVDQPTHPHAVVYIGNTIYTTTFMDTFIRYGACVHVRPMYREFIPVHTRKSNSRVDEIQVM